MKGKKEILNLAIALIIIILVLIGSLFLFSFSKGFYKSQFEKNNIYNEFEIQYPNLTKQELNDEFFKVTDYISDKTTSVNSSFFNSKEKSHLNDVKQIFSNLKIIFFILQTILLIVIINSIYTKDKEEAIFTLKSVTRSLNQILVFLGVLVTTISIDFTRAFTVMHKIMFSNDLYILNPATDNLILYLPETIFYSIMVKIFLTILLIILIFNLFNITKHKKKIVHTYKNGKKKR